MSDIVADPGIITDHPTREAYEDLGVLHVPEVITAEEVAEIREAFMAKVESDVGFGFEDGVAPDDILARYPRFVHPHRHLDTDVGRLARRLMLDPRILDIVQRLVGPAYAAQSMFYFKPPSARGQALHQDNRSLQAHPETCIAAWIAIDDCDADNGGLMVVPGSHRNQLMCLEPADAEQSFSAGQVPLPEDVDVHQTTMRAGDVLFFHGSMVHGSRKNVTLDRFRRSLIFHYIPQAATEVSEFYDPLLTPAGDEVSISASAAGGACGEGWGPGDQH